MHTFCVLSDSKLIKLDDIYKTAIFQEQIYFHKRIYLKYFVRFGLLSFYFLKI